MIHNEYKWPGFGGIMLHGQSWSPARHPVAVINFVHGFKDHSNRFGSWAPRFTEHGYAVVAIDLRGHGLSGGRRGYTRSYDNYLEDIRTLMFHSAELFKNSFHFLYGHSLGGNLVTNYLIRGNDLPGAAVVASPWFTLTAHPSWFKIIMAQLTRFFLPTLTVASDLDVRYLSRNPAVGEDYKKDPLVHNLIRPKLFFEIEQHGLKASRSIYKINVPMLVMHGSGDKICSFKQTHNFVMNAGPATTFREWPGAYHELHNEVNEKEVFDFVLDWLNSIVPRQ